MIEKVTVHTALNSLAVRLTRFYGVPSLQLALAQDQSNRYHHGIDCSVCGIPRIDNNV
jgi:hypothetical protein